MQKNIGLYLLTDVRSHALIVALWFSATLLNYPFALQACSVHVANELHGIDDTRDTCAVSRYFVLLRYTAVYRDIGDTSIVA